jgi:tRNA modification GTPase
MIPWQQLDNDTSVIIALNKSDLPRTFTDKDLTELTQHISNNITTVNISATTGDGIDNIRKALTDSIDKSSASESDILITNARHAQALGLALDSIQRVITGLDMELSGDFIAQDIRETIQHLSDILGQISDTQILSYVFSRFCIGK